MRDYAVYTGSKIGDWEILGYLKKPKGKTYFSARCECGFIKEVYSTSILNGSSTNCGCKSGRGSASAILRKYPAKDVKRLKSIWSNMHSRCSNDNLDCYKYYGGKGIKVCKRWNSFLNFFTDMYTEDYHESLEVDRIDGSKGYQKDNCRWATRSLQMRNTEKWENSKGYYFIERDNSWVAKYQNKDKGVSLRKYFKTEDSAKKQREEWLKTFEGDFNDK